MLSQHRYTAASVATTGTCRRTRAEGRLCTDEDTHLTGVGAARRDPGDLDVFEIGDEVAVAHALFRARSRAAHRRGR
jgi:Rv2632c-like